MQQHTKLPLVARTFYFRPVASRAAVMAECRIRWGDIVFLMPAALQALTTIRRILSPVSRCLVLAKSRVMNSEALIASCLGWSAFSIQTQSPLHLMIFKSAGTHELTKIQTYRLTEYVLENLSHSERQRWRGQDHYIS